MFKRWLELRTLLIRGTRAILMPTWCRKIHMIRTNERISLSMPNQ
jgi:hypothetical protein